MASPPPRRSSHTRGPCVRAAAQSLPPVLVKLVNIMAKHFHAVWAMGKATSGWRYGQTRDDEALVHPLLKPFSKLTPEAQADNRALCQQAGGGG